MLKTILAVLIGLMGGGVAVLAQTNETPAVTPPAAAAVQDAPATSDAAATPAVAAQAAPALTAKGKKDKKKKEKMPKQTPMNVVQGTLTVDGWTGKARLNYDIPDLKFVYLWAPGVGTVVVTDEYFPAGKYEQNAFSGNTLTVEANGHTIQLTSDKKLLRDKKPVSAYVYVDPDYKFASQFPAMGYGNTARAPYAWPGAKDVVLAKGATAPPLPANLRPTMAKAGCVPPGGKAIVTPCPIAAASAAVPAAGTTAPASQMP